MIHHFSDHTLNDNLFFDTLCVFSERKGAKRFIKLLENINIKIGIATGNWCLPAKIKLKALDLEHLIPNTVTSSEIMARKDILWQASEKLRMFERQIPWYIGDSTWDAESAKALGYNFLGVGKKLRAFGLLHWTEDFQNTDRLLKLITHGK